MADITMCTGDGCPLKDGCYRHKARACEYMQSYFCDPPYDPETNTCNRLWKMEPEEEEIEANE